MNWYATKGSGGQGIVIDEDTGRNVAVAYDEKDTAMLAAAPDMAEALLEIADICDGPAASRAELSVAVKRSARAALEKAGVI